jgi:hypothetical protein
VVAKLLIAGDHNPWIPLVDVVGSAGIELPAQYGPNVPKEGAVFGVMVIVRVTLEAHCPLFGVNV